MLKKIVFFTVGAMLGFYTDSCIGAETRIAYRHYHQANKLNNKAVATLIGEDFCECRCDEIACNFNIIYNDDSQISGNASVIQILNYITDGDVKGLILVGLYESRGTLAGVDASKHTSTLCKLIRAVLSRNNLQFLRCQNFLCISVYDEFLSGGAVLSSELQKNKSLTELSLTNSRIDERNCKLFCKALKQHDTLKCLDLTNVGFCHNGCVILSDMIQHNKSIIFLNLANEEKSYACDEIQNICKALTENRSIKVLIFTNGKNFSSASRLNRPKFCASFIDVWRCNNVIQTINLWEDNTKQSDNRETYVHIMCDDELEYRTVIPMHEVIDLGVTDKIKGVSFLEGREINHAHCKDLLNILNNGQLSILNLSNQAIGETGVQILCDALKTNRTLTDFNISKNDIGLQGNEFRILTGKAIADMLVVNTSIKKIDISDNYLTGAGLEYVGLALASNASLTKLNIKGNGNIGPKAIKAITEGLETNVSITKLNIDELTPEEVQMIVNVLQSNDRIKAVNIGGECESLRSPSGRFNPSLTSLGLYKSNCCEKIFTMLMPNSLTVLDLRLCCLSTSKESVTAFSKMLKNQKMLTRLTFNGVNVVSESISALIELINTDNSLRELTISNCVTRKNIDSLIPAIVRNHNLKSLNISWNDARGVKFNELLDNSFLEELIMSNCLLTDADARLLFTKLPNNRHLTKLDISFNDITEDGIIRDSLSRCKLYHIDFRYNNLANQGVMNVCDSLRNNQYIKYLDLSRCNMGCKFLRGVGNSVGELLQKNESITYLNVDGLDEIDDREASTGPRNELIKGIQKHNNLVTFIIDTACYSIGEVWNKKQKEREAQILADYRARRSRATAASVDVDVEPPAKRPNIEG